METGNEQATNGAGEASKTGEAYAPDALEGKTAPQGDLSDVNLDLVLDVAVTLSLRVGQTELSIRELVNLAEGSVVALDRTSTEPLDVLVNGTLIAHGEIVIVDGQFGVRLTDVASPRERIETLN
jgi:flagellar motor switch protein FliN/FliY